VHFHTAFPELTARALASANRLLPGVGGIGAGRAPGRASASRLSPSWLTTLNEQAARRYNQMVE